MNFKTLQESYNANHTNGKDLAAQKELNKVKDLCRHRLLPELEELEKEIIKKGKEAIIKQYPALTDIISNKNSIKEEIERWMKKN